MPVMIQHVSELDQYEHQVFVGGANVSVRANSPEPDEYAPDTDGTVIIDTSCGPSTDARRQNMPARIRLRPSELSEALSADGRRHSNLDRLLVAADVQSRNLAGRQASQAQATAQEDPKRAELRVAVRPTAEQPATQPAATPCQAQETTRMTKPSEETDGVQVIFDTPFGTISATYRDVVVTPAIVALAFRTGSASRVFLPRPMYREPGNPESEQVPLLLGIPSLNVSCSCLVQEALQWQFPSLGLEQIVLLRVD